MNDPRISPTMTSDYNLPAMAEGVTTLGSYLREGREDTDLMLAFIDLAEAFGLSVTENGSGDLTVRGRFPEPPQN